MLRSCPLCGERKSHFISDLCYDMSIMGPSFPAKSKSSNVVCDRCGMVYVDTDVRQESFDGYYNSEMSMGVDYFKLFGVRETLDYYQRIYENIKPFIEYDSMILDLGCSLGDFSKFLMEKGYRNILGVSPAANDIRICREKGVPCRQASCFAMLPEFTGKFDFIVFSHTLEHILDAALALEDVKKMLKPNGKIYIEVPDAIRYGDIDYAPFFFLTYEHLAHYCLETLDNTAAAYGLDLLASDGYFKCEDYWVIYGIFASGAAVRPVKRVDRLKESFVGYLKASEERLNAWIAPLQNSREPLILWGIGASTAQLLNGTFDKCNVVKLVDVNTAKQGMLFNVAGRELAIEDPKTVEDAAATIVILPTAYKDPIIRQIRDMGLQNKVFPLAGSDS